MQKFIKNQYRMEFRNKKKKRKMIAFFFFFSYFYKFLQIFLNFN